MPERQVLMRWARASGEGGSAAAAASMPGQAWRFIVFEPKPRIYR